MRDLLWLTDDQMARIEPYFPLSHGIARVDDRNVLSGVAFVIHNGLRWRDAPLEYGPQRPCIIALSDGAFWGFLIVYSVT